MNHEQDERDAQGSRPDDAGNLPADPRRRGGSTPAQPDPNSPVVPEGGGLDSFRDQPPLPGLNYTEVVEAYRIEGPLPPPQILAQYDSLVPGEAKRILDDAHENEVLDREVTRKSFDTAITLEKRGFNVAAAITAACLILAFLSLLLLDPPESIAGTVVFGLGSAAPIVLGFLGNHRPQKLGESKQPPAGPPDA